MKSITRRKALTQGLGALGSGAASLVLPGCGLADGKPAEAPPLAEPGLAAHAAAKGLLYGAACEADHLDKDPAHEAAFLRECRVLVSQNELKWAFTRPAPGIFDFSRADRLAGFAAEHKLLFRGHTLLWHISNPAWLADALAGGHAAKLMEEHIWAVAGRYRGHMQSWDVVNEAVEPDDGRADGLRKTLWLDALGPGYIETAFHSAHEADPTARLVYNDYGLDYADNAGERKREAVLNLLARLRASKAPVQVLGVQAHLRGGRPFEPARMIAFLDSVESLGLEVYLTELDVNDIDLARRHSRRDASVAKTTADYLDAVLSHRAVKLAVTWGLSDKYSFRNEPDYRHWLWTSRPLPLDAQLRRKPMWQAMARAFDNAPARMAAVV